MKSKFDDKMQILSDCKDIAKKILKELKNEDQKKQLDGIYILKQIPDLASDNEMIEMHDYKEVREILKQVYIECAKTIMKILDSSYAYSNDPKISFNYSEPMNQIRAAEYIKILPNAFIGGPMKSAVSHPHPKVVKIAVEYYDSLPSELKYSDVLPRGFKEVIRQRKAELKS